MVGSKLPHSNLILYGFTLLGLVFSMREARCNVFRSHGLEGVEGLVLRRWGEEGDVTVGQLLLLHLLAEVQRGYGRGQHGGCGVKQEECDEVQRQV